MPPHCPVFRVVSYALHRDQHSAEFQLDVLTQARQPAVLPVTIDERSTEFLLQAADRSCQALVVRHH